MLRSTPANPLVDRLKLLSPQGPRPTDRTLQVLRKYDLMERPRRPEILLATMQQILDKEPSPVQLYSFSELAYLAARQRDLAGDSRAMELYLASAAHAYLYLFDERFRREWNPYDPQFRGACELYNASLEGMLRIAKKQGGVRPGHIYTVPSSRQTIEMAVVTQGRNFRDQDFEQLEFASDYEVQGLANRYRTYGLGVPLIAVRKGQPAGDPAAPYYPPGFSFPVTAFLRLLPSSSPQEEAQQIRRMVLEFHDPLDVSQIFVGNTPIPLETDLSTPLAYFLNNPELKELDVSTLGLLDPYSDVFKTRQGLYMLEPYQPGKIPVLMVHGLWSSPITWMEMFNDLRGAPEIRNRYQFWFYLYPTGQPFLRSAAQLREELARLRQSLDPAYRDPSLDQMVVVGHSMGGLVARLQVVDGGEPFWRLVSDQPFPEVRASDEIKRELAGVFYFGHNPSIRRVISIGAPFGGSRMSNRATRWLAHKLISVPEAIVHAPKELIEGNPAGLLRPDINRLPTSIDSLAPDARVLSLVRSSPQTPGVIYHNVAGVDPNRPWWSKIEDEGDGVVSLASARAGGSQTELIVPADHINVHRHPLTVLEVRRILLEHLAVGAAPMSPFGPPPFPPPRFSLQ